MEAIVCEIKGGAQPLRAVNFYLPPNCDKNVEMFMGRGTQLWRRTPEEAYVSRASKKII